MRSGRTRWYHLRPMYLYQDCWETRNECVEAHERLYQDDPNATLPLPTAGITQDKFRGFIPFTEHLVLLYYPPTGVYKHSSWHFLELMAGDKTKQQQNTHMKKRNPQFPLSSKLSVPWRHLPTTPPNKMVAIPIQLAGGHWGVAAVSIY